MSLPLTLSQSLHEHIRAAFTGIWIHTQENEEALAEILSLSREQHWTLATWDIDRGLQTPGQETPSSTSDPLSAIRSINALAQPESSTLLVLPNFHRFITNTEILQCLAHQIHQGKQNRTFIVILSPLVQIPHELQNRFVVLEHELPNAAQLERIASEIATDPGELPQPIKPLLDAAAGLTRFEAENAFSLSLVRHSKLLPPVLWELKTGNLKKSGLISLHRGSENFANLGGHNPLKQFCLQLLRNPHPIAKPHGILLLGVPGAGKSTFAKALGHETGRPVLVLNMGALMGSLVGETEANVRRALQIVDAMAPCICFIDEVEKALCGIQSSGQTDSGVTARLFGAFLTWLSDHETDVFTVCTSNNLSLLPPEFSRAERFDGVFFIDLPTTEEKNAIWPLYLKLYQLDESPDLRPCDPQWSGAEIKSCCRLSALLDISLKEAARQVVPVAATASESVERLRAWATGRCLDASQGGIYGTPRQPPPQSARRRIVPDRN